MIIHKFKENPDGSADLSVEMDSEEMRSLIEYAIIDMLRKGLTREEVRGENQTVPATAVLNYGGTSDED